MNCETVTGNEGYLQFYLSNFTSTQTLETAIRSIQYCNENTNTTGGLRLTRTEIFNSANGDRLNVTDVIILLTDGIPTRESDLLPAEVQRIKNRNIRIVGVGVTNKVTYYIMVVFYLLVHKKLKVSLFSIVYSEIP